MIQNCPKPKFNSKKNLLYEVHSLNKTLAVPTPRISMWILALKKLCFAHFQYSHLKEHSSKWRIIKTKILLSFLAKLIFLMFVVTLMFTCGRQIFKRKKQYFHLPFSLTNALFRRAYVTTNYSTSCLITWELLYNKIQFYY